MKTLKIAFGQMNPTVGDYKGNTQKIIQWIEDAEKSQADLILFPECALSGYPVWDLANKTGFVQEGLKSLNKIVKATKGKRIAVALGYIDKPAKRGGRSYNAFAWIYQGKLVQKQYKRLLPTYDVFLEDIFFEPGETTRSIRWKSHRVGPAICEDIWDESYGEKPLQDLKKQKVDMVVNLSASPYFQGADASRKKLLKKQAQKYRFPIFYVNKVGAQDDLIFDGGSMLVNASGTVVYQAPFFEEGLFYCDWDSSKKGKEIRSNKVKPIAEIYQSLVFGVRDYCHKNGFNKMVLGLSGGIDSAVVACIARDALGSGAVIGITMPSEYSSKGSWKDSEKLASNLGIEFRINPIRGKYKYVMQEYNNQKKQRKVSPLPKGKINLAMENLQARLRGLELMFVSNEESCLLLTTGNKSELALGYCTLYGDMAGGLCVIGDVYKMDVYGLAKYVNRNKEIIPNVIISKPPSAELRPNQKDEDSLPPYEILDQILYYYIEKNMSGKEIVSKLKRKRVSGKLIYEVIRKVDHNEYKRRQTPPVLRVTKKSWFGRRMPITNLYREGVYEI